MIFVLVLQSITPTVTIFAETKNLTEVENQVDLKNSDEAVSNTDEEDVETQPSDKDKNLDDKGNSDKKSDDNVPKLDENTNKDKANSVKEEKSSESKSKEGTSKSEEGETEGKNSNKSEKEDVEPSKPNKLEDEKENIKSDDDAKSDNDDAKSDDEVKDEDVEEVKSLKEQKKDLISELSEDTLVYDRDTNTSYYKGEIFNAPGGTNIIPMDLDELWQIGATKEVWTENGEVKSKSVETMRTSIKQPKIATFSLMAFSVDLQSNQGDFKKLADCKSDYNKSSNKPWLVYCGPATDDLSSVGIFLINGEVAFCFQHSKASPNETSKIDSKRNPLSNEKVKKALYYGYGGEGNVLGNTEKAFVTTSLALSDIYSSNSNDKIDRSGRRFNSDYFQKYWKKIQDEPNLSNTISFSNSKPKVSIKNGKQRTDSVTFKADKRNTISFKLPNSVSLRNETQNKTISGGNTVTLKGGDKFYLEANSLTYNTTFKRDNLKGSMSVYQPMLTITSSSAEQNVGWASVTDPQASISLTAEFKKQEATITVEHRDYQGNQYRIVDDEKIKQTIGSTYKVCPKNNLSKSGVSMKPVKGSTDCKTGTVPADGKTVTFYYDSKHQLVVEFYDYFNNKKLKTYKTYSNLAPGTNVDVKLPNSFMDTKFSEVNTMPTKYVLRGGDNNPRTWQVNRSHGEVRTVRVNYTPYHNVRVDWMNKFSPKQIFKNSNKDQKVGFKYSFTPNATFKEVKNGEDMVYDRETTKKFEGTLGYKDISHVFEYRLRRTITVNYLDNRTGAVINPKKSYTVHQGDSYSESPIDIKKGDYEYRYVRHSGHAQKGTVGVIHLNMNYHYDIPLVKLGLEKLQIYTAQHDEGLPVKVKLSKEFNYDTKIADMKDKSKTITVALYDGNKKLDSETFVAKDIPEDIDFMIPDRVLTQADVKNYTVKLEGYNENDFDVLPNQEKLTTEGHTSKQETIEVDMNSQAINDIVKNVVMTEVTPTTAIKKFYEEFTYSLNPIEKEKSGYGVETALTYNYSNQLGEDYQLATEINDAEFDFHSPKVLQDSNLDYEVKDGNMVVPLESEQNSHDNANLIDRRDLFEFPHMNVEKQSGNLYTDQQVEDGDSSIENDLRDGGRKFYTPVWANIDKYAVSYKSTEIGAHKIKLVFNDNINIYAQMMATMDSETKDLDEILFMPINAVNPFASGLPDNWTEDEAQWLKY